MDGRMKKYGQLSPERAKVWTEKSPKYQQQQPARLSNGKVPVVYYLCRNRQLEHPHFIEVPLSSSDGLYLRDVIERLNVLRGRGMASLYSWSCKRSYKNGFVWHDLCEDDLILPAHGNEYVLKGSELFDESDAGRFSPAGNVRLSNPKLLPEPQSSRSQDDHDTSSSSSMNEKGTKNFQDDESSPPVPRSGSSAVSPQSSSADKSSSWNGSLSLAEYKIYKNEGLADASTQTDENANKITPPETCTRGVSTDDGSIEPENNEIHEVQVQPTNESAQMCRETVSPAPSSSSASSSGGRTDTLESLIRADINKLNSFRIIEGEEFRVPKTKLKPSNVLMQLISCGSISVKDHSFGLIPTYRPRFSHSKFPSPLFSTSLTLGELDCLAENPRFMSLRLEDKEYFSGSLLETKEKLVNHFKQIHEREHTKRLNQIESARGKMRVKLVAKYAMKMDKYKGAVRDVLTPKVGYGLADDLKRAGFWVRTVSDKPQAADIALRNHLVDVMDKRMVDYVVLVSDDSDFVEVLKEARLRCLKTVVVGDSNDGALKRTADAAFSWQEIMMGKAKKEAVSVVGRWKDRDVLKRLEWTYDPEVEKKVYYSEVESDDSDGFFSGEDDNEDVGASVLKEDASAWWKLDSRSGDMNG